MSCRTLYARASALQRRANGPNSAGEAEILKSLAVMHKEQKKTVQAEDEFKKSLSIYNSKGNQLNRMELGHFKELLKAYASFLQEQGRGAESAKMEQQASQTAGRSAGVGSDPFFQNLARQEAELHQKEDELVSGKKRAVKV